MQQRRIRGNVSNSRIRSSLSLRVTFRTSDVRLKVDFSSNIQSTTDGCRVGRSVCILSYKENRGVFNSSPVEWPDHRDAA